MSQPKDINLLPTKASGKVLMASAWNKADLLLTQNLLNDANISYLKELAVPDDPQIESVPCILPHHSFLIDLCD